MSDLTAQRTGKRCDRVITWGMPMDLGDCATREVPIRSLLFFSVDYGDITPMSLELPKIIWPTKKEEKKQCGILHLASCLLQSESVIMRSPPPLSRVAHVAKG